MISFRDLNNDTLFEISTFLTIYENYQLLFVVKDIYIDWKYLQKRDFPQISLEASRYNAIHLDNGNLLSTALRQKYIAKNIAMKMFNLRRDHLGFLIPDMKIRYWKFYDVLSLQKLSAYIHSGMTNLKLKNRCHEAKIKEQKAQETIWRKERKIENANKYQFMTRFQRANLLDDSFTKYNMKRPCQNHLCRKFIRGQCFMDVEEIVNVIYLSELIMNTFGNSVYTSFRHKSIELFYEIKYKNKECSWNYCANKAFLRYFRNMESVYIHLTRFESIL